MLRTLIDLLKGTREWFVHFGWLLAGVALMGLAMLLTPEDSLYSTTIDPVRMLWKLSMASAAAWAGYWFGRLMLPYRLRLDVLHAEWDISDPQSLKHYTALICAVVIGRLLFMGLFVLAVSGGV